MASYKIGQWCGLIIFSTLLVFVSAEGVVRTLTHFLIFYDIEMTRYANELKMVAPTDAIGHLHIPGSNARLMGVEVQINSDGFRDREYPVGRSAGVPRVIFLGDSLTFGWGVEQENRFSELIETRNQRLDSVEIINFGTGNYNLAQEVALFELKGRKYKPDQVVVFYFINDAEPTPQKSKWSFLSHSRFLSFCWSRWIAAQGRRSSSLNYLDFYRSLYREEAAGWKEVTRAVRALKKLADDDKFELKFVLLPELHDPGNYPFSREHQLLKTLLDENQIEHFDVIENAHFPGVPLQYWVALDDAHPNARAHQIIAESSYSFVVDTIVAH